MTLVAFFAIIITQEKKMEEIEFIMYTFILVGVAYTSWIIGKKDGIQDAISYFHEEGYIDLDRED